MSRRVMLADEASGEYLAAPTADGATELRRHVCDECIWTVSGDGLELRSLSGCELSAAAAGADPAAPTPAQIDEEFGTYASLLVPPRHTLSRASVDDPLLAGGRVFGFVDAPERLPSEYLADLETQGYTILDGCMSKDMVRNVHAVVESTKQRLLDDPDTGDRLRKAITATHDFQLHFGGPKLGLIQQTPSVARSVTHPVALFLIRSYLGHEVHLGHIPAFSLMRPAQRVLESPRASGWHADYPNPLSALRPSHTNHPEYERMENGEEIDVSTAPEFEAYRRLDREIVEAGYPNWQERQYRLGVQFNICVSDFTAGNASTMFVLNTHKLAEHTPDQVEINRQLEMGDGLFAGAIQFEAPAGAAIIYDSRMYHRAAPELQASDTDRMAIITATMPTFVRPKDVRPYQDADYFAQSTVPTQLSKRELKDIVALIGEDDDGNIRPEITRAML